MRDRKPQEDRLRITLLPPVSINTTSTCIPWRRWLLRAWSLDQRQQYHLGAWEKFTLGPAPDLRTQNLHFNRIPRRLLCAWTCEKLCERGNHIPPEPTELETHPSIFN